MPLLTKNLVHIRNICTDFQGMQTLQHWTHTPQMKEKNSFVWRTDWLIPLRKY